MFICFINNSPQLTASFKPYDGYQIIHVEKIILSLLSSAVHFRQMIIFNEISCFGCLLQSTKVLISSKLEF